MCRGLFFAMFGSVSFFIWPMIKWRSLVFLGGLVVNGVFNIGCSVVSKICEIKNKFHIIY